MKLQRIFRCYIPFNAVFITKHFWSVNLVADRNLPIFSKPVIFTTNCCAFHLFNFQYSLFKATLCITLGRGRFLGEGFTKRYDCVPLLLQIKLKKGGRWLWALGKINFMFVVVKVYHEETTCLYDSIKLKIWHNLIYDFFCLNRIRERVLWGK
jgi:hypothetical protein